MSIVYVPQDHVTASSAEAVERYNESLHSLLIEDASTFWAKASTIAVQRSLDTFQRFARFV
jgi:hypothetical protein